MIRAIGKNSTMRLPITFAAIITCTLLRTTGSADTPDPVVELGPSSRNLVVGPHMDASDTRLYDTKLVGQDLTGSNFDGADLSGAWIEDCNLRGVSFRGTDFTHATIVDCRIAEADFTNAVINKIMPVRGPEMLGRHNLHLSESQLKSTASYKRQDLSYCVAYRIDNLDLRGFDLRGASLTYCHNAMLENALIRGGRVVLSGSEAAQELRKTLDFQSGTVRCDLLFKGCADLSDICVYESDIYLPRDVQAEQNVKVANAEFYGCRVVFRGDSARRLLPTTRSYKKGRILWNSFTRNDMSQLSFDELNITGCDLSECDLTETTFDNAIIDYALFRETKGLTEAQIKSTWNYKNGRMSTVTLPEHLEPLKEPATEE